MKFAETNENDSAIESHSRCRVLIVCFHLKDLKVQIATDQKGETR